MKTKANFKKEYYTIQEVVDLAKCPIDKTKKLIFVEQHEQALQIQGKEFLELIENIYDRLLKKDFNPEQLLALAYFEEELKSAVEEK